MKAEFDFIFYFCILNGSLALIELFFFGKFVNKTLKGHQYLLYMMSIYIVCAVEVQMRTSFVIATLLELMVLFVFGCVIVKCTPALCATTTILTVSIMQVTNGIFQTLGSLLSRMTFPNVALPIMVCSVSAIIVTYCSYRYVIKAFKIKQILTNQYAVMFLLPILFVLIVIQHIFMIYGNTVVVDAEGNRIFPVGNDWEMLFIQVVAYICIFAVLFAYRKLEEAYELQTQNVLLIQQVDTQQNYIQEAQMRYEQTRSFRHDFKNHLTVVNSLLVNGESQKASEYLDKLQVKSDEFSFPCETGSVFLDMLLSNKLGLAQQKGIKVDCTVQIPSKSKMDELDLCIVFANAIDNAIKACEHTSEKEPYMIISAVRKGKFFMIEIQNSCGESRLDSEGSGIGLLNIKSVAEKYRGTISIEREAHCFKLNALFLT